MMMLDYANRKLILSPFKVTTTESIELLSTLWYLGLKDLTEEGLFSRESLHFYFQSGDYFLIDLYDRKVITLHNAANTLDSAWDFAFPTVGDFLKKCSELDKELSWCYFIKFYSDEWIQRGFKSELEHISKGKLKGDWFLYHSESKNINCIIPSFHSLRFDERIIDSEFSEIKESIDSVGYGSLHPELDKINYIRLK